MKKYFVFWAKASLILVYLVILAGATVRMTGSGMGCPDWPKCFGYYIPPTHENDLSFKPNTQYNKGQAIINNENLFVAKNDFKSTNSYNSSDWEKYTKHDYAIFNVYHTWVEYINRLLGALAGLACFITLIVSLSFWNTRKLFVFLAFGICVLMGFQAWLGKTVVDSVLNPYKITTHMLVAFLIVALQLYLIFQATSVKKPLKTFNPLFFKLSIVALALTTIQVVFGTNVREYIDHIAESGLPKILWLQSPEWNFYVHRSFSIIVLFVNMYIFYLNKKKSILNKKINWVGFILLLEIFTGIVMSYFHFPFGSQTLHLILASVLFGIQFYIFLEEKNRNSI